LLPDFALERFVGVCVFMECRYRYRNN